MLPTTSPPQPAQDQAQGSTFNSPPPLALAAVIKSQFGIIHYAKTPSTPKLSLLHVCYGTIIIGHTAITTPEHHDRKK